LHASTGHGALCKHLLACQRRRALFFLAVQHYSFRSSLAFITSIHLQLPSERGVDKRRILSATAVSPPKKNNGVAHVFLPYLRKREVHCDPQLFRLVPRFKEMGHFLLPQSLFNCVFQLNLGSSRPMAGGLPTQSSHLLMYSDLCVISFGVILQPPLGV